MRPPKNLVEMIIIVIIVIIIIITVIQFISIVAPSNCLHHVEMPLKVCIILTEFANKFDITDICHITQESTLLRCHNVWQDYVAET